MQRKRRSQSPIPDTVGGRCRGHGQSERERIQYKMEQIRGRQGTMTDPVQQQWASSSARKAA